MKKETLETKTLQKDFKENRIISCSLPIRSVNPDGSYGKVLYRLDYSIKAIN